MSAITLEPTTIEAVQAAVVSAPHLHLRGGGTKVALHANHAADTLLDLRKLAGILEYVPGEYTFTALAGTTLSEVETALAAHSQYLPFDPPFAAQGATLGGTVAAGLSGSGRYRYGGVRDFLIGARFVDGQGRLVRGGGKVVKNAAGFDLPKLMVGSLGGLGVLVELSFKVFPEPPHYSSLVAPYPELPQALAALQRLADSRFDLYALDLVVEPAGAAPTYTLWARLGGLANVLPQRMEQLRKVVGAGEILTGEEEATTWRATRDFRWRPTTTALVKVALTLHKISTLEAALAQQPSPRRYAAGGNLAWLAWAGPLPELDRLLTEQGLAGLTILGQADHPFLGNRSGHAFVGRLKQALDPASRFCAL